MYTDLPLIVGDLMGGGYKTFCLKYKYNIFLSLVWDLYTIINWVSLCDCNIQSLAFFFLHFNFCFTAFLIDCNSEFYQHGILFHLGKETFLTTNMYFIQVQNQTSYSIKHFCTTSLYMYIIY